MAIGVHVVTWCHRDGVPCVEPTDGVTNSADYPTIAEYVAAEAADGYAVNHLGYVDRLIVSYSVADMNSEGA